MEGVAKKKESELGILSLIFISIEAILYIYINAIDWNVPWPYLNVIQFFIILGLPLISLICGIGGLFQKERTKLLPILGIVISFPTLCYLGFMYYALTYLSG